MDRQRKWRKGALKTSDTISDPRFKNIQTDPRFRLPSKRNTHVQIDKRFASILEDEAFSSTAKVDRYGRKLPKDKAKQDLRKFYRIEDEDDDEDAGPSGIDDKAVRKELGRLHEEAESESSDSSSEDEDEQGLDTEEEEVFGIVEEGGDGGAIPKGEVSSRLAVVNLDWDNIRAPDLMAVFQSFVPTTGQIIKVAVFPSEFGKERMDKEELEGPPQEIFAQKSEGQSDQEDQEDLDVEDLDDEEQVKKSILKEDTGAEFSSTHLRRYQMSRLRYYYAVITCSSASAASAIYDAVDGAEYLTTANFFDLRFIPDEMSFDDIPRDECMRLPDGYRPNEFVTEALQHSKVKLTWDADDGARKEVQKRAFGGSRKEIDDNDLKAYLGSDSDDEDDGINPGQSSGVADSAYAAKDSNAQPVTISKKEAERQRMRALLGLPTEPETRTTTTSKAPVGDMQVMFTSGLSAEDGKNHTVFENEPERNETTVEKYVRKEKERKAKRREQMKQKRTTGADIEQDSEGDNPEKAGPATNSEDKDLGFNDPFFSGTAPVPPSQSSTKAARRQKRLEREAAESANAVEEQKLESILTGPSVSNDEPDGNPTIKHFNITALARAEKLARKAETKKGRAARKQKLSLRDQEALEAAAKDDFKIDVKDDRFRDVFERAEFAIDPSHPRYMGTGGMRQLLNEGRKMKRGGEDDGSKPERNEDDEGRRKRTRDGIDDESVDALVKKIKKSKARKT